MESLAIILASVREKRRGEPFARWIHALASERPDVTASFVDLRDWPLGPYTRPVTTAVAESLYEEGSLPRRWGELVRAHDGFIIVTPEYNHGYPGQLKDAFDHLFPSWHHRAIAFVSYGGHAAGARAAEQLISVAVELRMVPVRDQVNIRLIGLQADANGWPSDELYRKRAQAMLDELLFWTRVTRQARGS
jgi:NAD(P)H-dependent FMN reductase